MRSESNTFPTLIAADGSLLCVLGAAGLGAGIGLALNRQEETLPAGADLALCFMALPAEVPEWIELIPAAAVAGADGRAWTNDKPADFIALSAQLKRIPAGWCIDFDHQLQLAATPAIGGTAPAAGWITQLEARNGAIWGKVEWTDLGTEAVSKKRYRGISPVFAFDKSTKRVLGLVSAALTNNPNLNLVALNAAQMPDPQEKSMNWIAKLLGLKDDATEDEIKTALNAVLGMCTMLAATLGLDLKAALALNAAGLKDALDKKFGSDVMVALCTQAGVAGDATADAIMAAIRAKGVDLSQYISLTAFNSVRDELATLKEGKAEALVEGALAAGKIVPAQKDWALNFAKSDLPGFEKYLGVTPTIVPAGTVKAPTGQTPVPGDEAAQIAAAVKALTTDELAMCTATNVLPEAFVRSKLEIASRAA